MASPAIQSPKYDLPTVRGSYRFDVPLAPTNWFRVGGPADVLFKPTDARDLADFLKAAPSGIPIHVIGVGSNLIIRDGGLEGVVIRLGRGFTDVTIEGDVLVSGAAVLDVNVARFAADNGRAGLEFYAGIPGTIGGALAMNAGAYEGETKDVLIKAEAVDRAGNIHVLSVDECKYTYRHFGGAEGLIFTRAWFKTKPGTPEAIHTRIHEITTKREATQPVRERTGGSTFKNPEGHKAWQLVEQAGCRGFEVDGAQMSVMHCNFMINTGNATAAALESLGDEVRKRVKDASGVELEWEIKRIGRA